MTKKNFDNINGWIILDKQSGITSRQAVSKISKILKFSKIGHGGTLDPLATGILPIALGEATKLISFIHSKYFNVASSFELLLTIIISKFILGLDSKIDLMHEFNNL